MNRRGATSILLAVVLFSAVLTGCVRPPRLLRPSGAGFSVELPGNYTCSQHRRKVDVASDQAQTCSVDLFQTGLFGRLVPARISITWERVSPDTTIETLLPDLRAAYEGDPSAEKQTVARPGQLGGVAGIEIETVDRAAASAGAVTIRARYVIHSRTLVGVIMDGQVDDDAERAWGAVLQSFSFES